MNGRVFRFRGKGIKSNAWFYGGYATDWNEKYEDEFYISVGLDAIQVKKETIGQYTGIKDKNEKEIYDGDIANSFNDEFGTMIGIVRYSEETCSFELHIDKYEIRYIGTNYNLIEVIGNIYDNPELLNEGGREND